MLQQSETDNKLEVDYYDSVLSFIILKKYISIANTYWLQTTLTSKTIKKNYIGEVLISSYWRAQAKTKLNDLTSLKVFICTYLSILELKNEMKYLM